MGFSLEEYVCHVVVEFRMIVWDIESLSSFSAPNSSCLPHRLYWTKHLSAFSFDFFEIIEMLLAAHEIHVADPSPTFFPLLGLYRKNLVLFAKFNESRNEQFSVGSCVSDQCKWKTEY